MAAGPVQSAATLAPGNPSEPAAQARRQFVTHNRLVDGLQGAVTDHAARKNAHCAVQIERLYDLRDLVSSNWI
jgi:hypothetical protein